MKKILFVALLASLSVIAFGQNVRVDIPWISVSNQNPPYVVANPNSAVLAVCNHPANQVPCTNFATTYTSLGVACPAGAQDTPQPQPSSCQSTSDAESNIGFWVPAGTYDITVCIQNNCGNSPYTITVGGIGGGPGTPNQAISFTNSNTVTLPTTFTTTDLLWDCYDGASPANAVYPNDVTVSSSYVVTFTFLVAQSGYCTVNGQGGGGGGGGGAALPASVPFVGTNSVSNGIPSPLAAGSVVAGSLGGIAAAQSKPVIDVRDYGVIGNGTTDDTTALQNAVNAACNAGDGSVGVHLIIPNGFQIKVSSTITFTKCLGVTFDGENSQGQTTYGANSNAALVWAGSAGGTVLEVNQTRDSEFGNLAISAGNANIGLLIDEIGSVSTITTNNHYSGLAIANGTQNSSWIAVSVCPTAPGNCEAQNFDRLLITCAGTLSSATSNGIGIEYGVGGEPYFERVRDYEASNCSKAIDLESGFNIDFDGGLMSGNWTDLQVDGGQLVRYLNFRSELAQSPIVIGTAGASGLKDLTIENDAWSGEANGSATIYSPFTTGTGGVIRIIKNAWDANTTITPLKTAGFFAGVLDSQDNIYPNNTICVWDWMGSNTGWSSNNDGPVNGTCNYRGLISGYVITSAIPTGTSPFSITSTTPVANLTLSNHPKVYEAGVLTTAEKIYTNTQALTTGAATHTLANSFTYTSSSTFGCTCTDQTAANACKAVPASATTVTLVGTGTDVLWLSCSGH